MAAGTVTATYAKQYSVRQVVVDWVSGTDGEAGTASGEIVLDGQIVKVVTNPSGTAAPDANYDITLVDEDGVDIAQGLIQNRHTSNTEEAYIFEEVTLGGTATDAAALPVYHSGPVTFTVANAGSAKAGRATIYYR